MSVFSDVRRNSSKQIGGLDMDVNWINDCFMLPRVKKTKNNPINKVSYSWMYFSTAETKFVNTSLGGNFTVNQPPAYTIFTDPPVGLLASKVDKESVALGITEGMGQYYSEAIDDNAHRIYLRFGHPEYKGLLTFFTGFYNARMAMLGNQGRTWTDAFYFLGKIVGTVLGLSLWIVTTIGWAVKLALGRPSTSYYSLRSSMPLYWRRVDLFANRLAAYMQLIPEGESLNDEGKNVLKEQGLEDPAHISESVKKKARRVLFDEYNAYMDGMFTDSGGIDIYRIVNKTNRMMQESALARQQIYEGATSSQKLADALIKHTNSFNPSRKARYGESLMEYLRMHHESPMGATVLKIDGKEYEVYRRDPITDRIQEGSKLDPFASGQAVTTGGEGEISTASPTAQQASELAQQTATIQNTPTTNIVGSSFTTTNTGNATAAANNILGSTSILDTVGGAISSTGVTTNTTDLARQNTTATNTSVTESAPALASEVPLGDGVLSDAPTGDEAKAMMREYSQQDTLINSILETAEGEENNEEGVLKRTLGWLSSSSKTNISAIDYFAAALRRGSDFVGFKVDAVQSVSESWSNSATDGEIAGAINGLSNAARAARYSLSDFKTGFGMVDTMITAVRSTVAGLMDGFQVSGILALAGSGMVDIPKRYADSSTQMSSSSYTISLRSAYGDPMSVFLNIYVPFMMLLAGAVPISHGSQSYGQPFFCELYDRGRVNIRLGLIDSLSVTRGAGTVAWSNEGLPLGIDINLNILNMCNIIHAPIDPGLSGLLPWNGMPNTDDSWNDYMGALSNLSLHELSNPYKKISMAWKAYRIGVDQFFNGARLGNWAADFGMVKYVSGAYATVFAPDFRATSAM